MTEVLLYLGGAVSYGVGMFWWLRRHDGAPEEYEMLVMTAFLWPAIVLLITMVTLCSFPRWLAERLDQRR